MAAARPSGEEEDIGRRRSYAIDAHELRRYRSHYSDATSAHERATSRARSRKSLGPPQGLARVPFEFKKFWRRQISVVVDQAYNRDHLGMETLSAPRYLTVSCCLSRVCLQVFPALRGVFIRCRDSDVSPLFRFFLTGCWIGRRRSKFRRLNGDR